MLKGGETMVEEKNKGGRPRKTDEEKQITKMTRRARNANEKAAEKATEKQAKEATKSKTSSKKRGGVGVNGNLVPITQMTEEERHEFCSKGGKASAESKRKKKELREFTKSFLMQDAAAVLKQNMGMLGVESDDMTNLAAIVIRLFSKAVNQGDLNAARTLIEWAGMAPLQQERENEAIARMSQIMQLAEGNDDVEKEDSDVVFYIPANGRPVIREGAIVTVGDDSD